MSAHVSTDEARRALSRADPVLRRLIAAKPQLEPFQLLPAMTVFAGLVTQIVGQQLSVTSARAILRRLEELFEGRAPTPAQLLAASESDLLAAGLSHRKLATLRDVSARFVGGELSEASLRAGSDDEVSRRLQAVPGIGPWTVQGVLMLALRRPDAFPAGDLAIRRTVARLYGLDALPDTAEVERIAERWRPFRSLAAGYLIDDDTSSSRA